MNEPVLDTSVILAIAKSERIDELALALVDGGVMSAVNVSEVYAKLADWKLSPALVEPLLNTLARIEPLTLHQARIAADLRDVTRQAGLSLGDRCCLALAVEQKAEAYTTDRSWTRVSVQCKIHLLRQHPN